MPVTVFVGQIARVNADGFVAILAGVGEVALVALDAKGFVLLEHIALAGQVRVAVAAEKVVDVETLVHRLEVLVGENQLHGPFFQRRPQRVQRPARHPGRWVWLWASLSV